MTSNLNICIISVITNHEQYNKLIAHNPFLQKCILKKYDNTQENLPIPLRYNHFIEHEMPEDAWLVFCHQDFEFLESPSSIVSKLTPDRIYGAVGVKTTTRKTWNLKIGGKSLFSSHTGTDIYPIFYGQIRQGKEGQETLIGQHIAAPHLVDTVDECCLIVHSSLIRKFNLRFDPVFDFHLYSADFSLSARKHSISTCAVQINCRHISPGNVNQLFWEKYQLLLKKYPTEFFLTTCVGVKQFIQQSLALRWPLFHDLGN